MHLSLATVPCRCLFYSVVDMHRAGASNLSRKIIPVSNEKVGRANVVGKTSCTTQNTVSSCSHAACSEKHKTISTKFSSKVVETKNQVEKGLEFVVEHAHAKTINDIPNCHANGKTIFIISTSNFATLQKPVFSKRCFAQKHPQPLLIFGENLMQNASFQKTLKTTYHSSSVDDTCPKQIYSMRAVHFQVNSWMNSLPSRRIQYDGLAQTGVLS